MFGERECHPMSKKANPAALLPILVFLVLYLGLGLVFEYVLKIPMGFYNVPIVVAFLAAILVACLQNRSLDFDKKLEKDTKYQWELSEYLNRDICQPEGFDAYGYPSELFKLDMERLGIIPKRKPAKVIDFTRYIDTNRSSNH